MIAVGVISAFAAAVANAFAIVLQASEARVTPIAESARFALLARLFKRPRWLLGTALLAIGWPLQVLALSFAPITVVQPVLSTSQLFLLLLARVELHERIGSREASGVVAVMAGVTIVIVAAPHHTVAHPAAGRVAVPLAVIGVAALIVYVFSRVRGPQGHGLWLALGAGLGYAWVDFTDKLLSNAIVASRLLVALVWALAVMAFGALAFLEENSALQVRSPVVVGPVIGAIQEPLPVLMALWAGVEAWNGGASQVVELVAGLALVALGAATLAHSPAVARVSHEGGAPP